MIATYYYDPFGRRLWKEVGGVRTYFFYADEGLIGEYDSTDNEIKTYGYRPDSAWTTNPLFMKDGSEHFFYHNDHLGIPQKMTAVNGAVVWAAKYTSFLNAEVDSSSTSENNLRAPGQYYDGETGLYYNLNRFYDPQLGRYLRADPIRLRSGINLFTYAKNNPLAYFDPFGLKEESAGGCGPGPIGDWFVPDKPAGYDFGSCCNDHDDCYKGKMGCDKEQPDCDDAFKKCMDDKCSKYNDIGLNKHNEQYPEERYHGQSRSECERIADFYHWAVSGKIGAYRLNKAREKPSSPCYKGPNPKDNVIYNASPSPATGY